MSNIYATIIADSLDEETGNRCTTMEVQYPRFVHAELMTHRVFSRNSASSRAVPVSKFLDQVRYEPALPVVWASEQPGMQGGDELEGQALVEAQAWWNGRIEQVAEDVEDYIIEHPGQRLHKSLLNRWLEPALPHKVIITATEWENFFNQRSTRRSPLAQPEIARAADLMLAAYEESTPQRVGPGDWHLPYINEEDWEWAATNGGRQALVEVSAARCARVSYLTHDGIRDPLLDQGLYRKLISASPMHASPLEHPAVVCPENDHEVEVTWRNAHGQVVQIKRRVPKVGNLLGFLQQRAVVEAERGI